MFPKSSHPNQTVCKCCGNSAYLYDVCDFNKSCQEKDGKYLRLCGIPIYYYKCYRCGFIFTEDFDNLTISEFKENIYNEGYSKIDPDYVLIRPQSNAKLISNIFSEFKKEIKILDYGGGNGVLENNLRLMGFKEIETYDTFNEKFSEKPIGQYNLIVSFEVIEHVPDPYETFEKMFSLLDDKNGLIMFTTVLLPDNIDKVKTRWWYISPRNGHISIHTPKSIRILLEKFGLNFVSAKNQILHYAYKTIPIFARHIFK